MEKQNGYGCHLPSEYLFDKINILRQGDFGMYYIIGTTIYREPEAKFIYKDKLVYPVSYTHLDVYKRQAYMLCAKDQELPCEEIWKIPAAEDIPSVPAIS